MVGFVEAVADVVTSELGRKRDVTDLAAKQPSNIPSLARNVYMFCVLEPRVKGF